MTEGEKKFCEYQVGRTGRFYTALFETIFCADHINMDRLREGFKEEVRAVVRYSKEDGYHDRIMAEYRKTYGGLRS